MIKIKIPSRQKINRWLQKGKFKSKSYVCCEKYNSDTVVKLSADYISDPNSEISVMMRGPYFTPYIGQLFGFAILMWQEKHYIGYFDPHDTVDIYNSTGCNITIFHVLIEISELGIVLNQYLLCEPPTL